MRSDKDSSLFYFFETDLKILFVKILRNILLCLIQANEFFFFFYAEHDVGIFCCCKIVHNNKCF